MAKRTRSAGGLHDLYGFESREPADDGYGNDVSGPWVERFATHAETIFMRGSETVMAARLEGRQPVMLRVRNSTDARSVTTDWRAHDKRAGTYFNIRASSITPDRAFIEMIGEAGVAA